MFFNCRNIYVKIYKNPEPIKVKKIIIPDLNKLFPKFINS